MWKRNLVLGLIAGCTIFSIAEGKEIRYDKGKRRDPFQPILGGETHFTGKEGLIIEGIVFDPRGSSYALIGGQIFREGESWENAKLIKIFPDRVILLQDNEEVVIWLREEVLQGKQNWEEEKTNE